MTATNDDKPFTSKRRHNAGDDDDDGDDEQGEKVNESTTKKRIKTETASVLATLPPPKLYRDDDNDDGEEKESSHDAKRWRAHVMLEQYVDTVSALLMPGTTIYPYIARMERVTALGYLTSPLRRTTVWEEWSPKEVALFEAALLHYGKEFSKIRANCLPKKTTKDVVAFYYIWKKTSHYQNWKKQYEPDEGAWIMDNKKTTATTTAVAPYSIPKTTSSGKSK